MYDDQNRPWRFDWLAKRASLLFDKIYLTDNLDLTCDIISQWSDDGDFRSQTLRYLTQKGFILVPQDLGYTTGEALLKANTKGDAARLQQQLLRIGNPSNNCESGDYTYVGQPDIGDWEAHDGCHPRSDKGWGDPQIDIKKEQYESLLLRRNVAMLRCAGVADVAVVGRLHKEKNEANHTHPVWKVVINEMPDFDARAPWNDVFDFRAEDRTQHLVRNLRRWIRKIVAEKWPPAELEDEIRELIYEYENHLRVARMSGGKGVLTCVITGTAGIAENVIKMRLFKIASLVTAVIDQRSKLLEAETKAPGRELALLPELKKKFLY